MTTSHQFTITNPSADAVEVVDGVHIYLDLPGVSAHELSIDLEEEEITICGKSTYTASEKDTLKIIHREFSGNTLFKRTFTLSDMVDRENITATLKDGVLDLFLPRSESMKPKKILVQTVPSA